MQEREDRGGEDGSQNWKTRKENENTWMKSSARPHQRWKPAAATNHQTTGAKQTESAATAAGGNGSRKRRRKEIRENAPDKQKLSDLVDQLIAEPVKFSESQLGSGPWQVWLSLIHFPEQFNVHYL